MSSTKVNQLQLVQQNLQNIMLQKQQVEAQLTELNSALEELKGTKKAYKIVGKIMISTSEEKLTKDLEEKKEVAELRLNNFVKQEEKLKETITLLQKEAMGEMKKDE